MKTKRLIFVATMLMVLAGVVACSRARNDAAIITEVQAAFHQNAALVPSAITVQSRSGVVVLSGTVATDNARTAAEEAARQVDGVKDVVNNLQLAAVVAPEPAPVAAEERTPKPRSAAPRMPRRAKSSRADAPAAQPPAPPTQAAMTPPPQEATAREPQPVAPVPATVTIPAGTRLTVRLIDPVDTAKNRAGDTFGASLESPVVAGGKVVIPKYARVTAQLVSAKSAGRFAGSSSIVLVLSRIAVGDSEYEVQTSEYAEKGASRGGRTAKVIGGTAAVGAVIGAIAGGGKGAAVGAAAGAGAGTAAQALTKGEQIKLPSESLLDFQLQAPLTVTLAG